MLNKSTVAVAIFSQQLCDQSTIVRSKETKASMTNFARVTRVKQSVCQAIEAQWPQQKTLHLFPTLHNLGVGKMTSSISIRIGFANETLVALRLIARDQLLRAESKLRITPDRSALMRITEQDLDKAANYRVLNKIGQGAFGEVNSSKIREISCTSFSLRAMCACKGLEGIA